jgi:chromosome segregation ATPase
MERTANLDANRKTITITLGGARWRISRVVTGVRRRYAEILTRSGEEIEKVSRLQALQEKDELTDEDARELGELVETLGREVDEFQQWKTEELYRCLELLLEKNGYEFDREWWDDNADIGEIQEFITAALTKDQESKKEGTGGGSDGTG